MEGNHSLSDILNTFKHDFPWLQVIINRQVTGSAEPMTTKTKDWMNARDMMKCGDLCEPVLILCIVTRNRRESSAAA